MRHSKKKPRSRNPEVEIDRLKPQTGQPLSFNCSPEGLNNLIVFHALTGKIRRITLAINLARLSDV